MPTPPARRRVHPAVAVRRAQSERRYLSPWQAGAAPPLLHVPPGSGWARFEHHHATRTAYIPPLHPRLCHPQGVGRPKVVMGVREVWTGTVSYHPCASMSRAQLPPLALGSPPAVAAPHTLLPPPITLEDRLAQDRLTAFLAAESLPHRPRSILSCPESPLYESLVSCMSDLDDDSVAFPDAEAEHEYQQIPALDPFADKAARAPRDSPRSDKNGASGKRRDASGSSSDGQKETQHIAASKLNTLDVKPEKGASKESSRREESLVCHCQRKSPERRHSSAKLSPASRTSGSGSSQSLSSQDNHKSAIYISNTTICRRDESAQESSDSDDTYQDISDAPTVIHVISHKDSKDSVKKPDSSHAPKERSNASFSPADGHRLPPRSGHTASSGSTKTCLKTRANSAEKLPHSKAQGTSYPPLTIELSERKEDPAWGPDPGKARGGKTSSASHSSTPHIITTLDPPLKPATKAQTHYDSMSDIPPLVVNFDAEDSDSNSETFIDIGTSTVGGSTSIYLTEDETSSLYSSVPDLYSVVTTDPDSFVYVYKPPPRRQSLLQKRLQDSELDYRFPGYVIARGSGGSSGGSCTSEGSWSDTISFVEPTYRPPNLSVGSRGHLKIDYSCSWTRLDDFVRTASPRGASQEVPKLVYRSGGALPPTRPPKDASPASVSHRGPALSPWERYTDPVAG